MDFGIIILTKKFGFLNILVQTPKYIKFTKIHYLLSLWETSAH